MIRRILWLVVIAGMWTGAYGGHVDAWCLAAAAYFHAALALLILNVMDQRKAKHVIRLLAKARDMMERDGSLTVLHSLLDELENPKPARVWDGNHWVYEHDDPPPPPPPPPKR